jgi:hypothetical protein
MLKDILTQIGVTSVVIGIAGYLFKMWLSLKLETVRSEWAKEVARLNVHETYLHKRRVELIEEMYAEMVEAEFHLQTFLVSWWASSNKEELIERGLLPQDHFSEERTDSMEERGFEFCERFLKINSTLHRNALFFDDSFIEEITGAYKPFVDTILNFDYNSIPIMPKELKELVTVGRIPRRAIINKFRALLGVEQ